MSEPTLPTKDIILRLPRWAVVAFAARCARRVEPLTRGLGAIAYKAIEQVILKAEAIASFPNAPNVTASAATAYDDAAAFVVADDTADLAAVASRRAAFCAAYAAYATVFATDDAADFAADAATSADNAAFVANTFAAAAAAEAAGNHDPVEGVSSLRTIVSDFQRLEDAARIGSWTDDTPVPPEVFGPLWPEGAPPWA
ncbi:MAG: hypothetical protein IT581_14375 [Verrucomicrobiales bacterium]|nr:hypothetical protein [Verrucomicrobiales bacterium]